MRSCHRTGQDDANPLSQMNASATVMKTIIDDEYYVRKASLER